MNRLRPRAYALFIAASLGFVSAPAHLAAQAGTGTFSGTVVDDQGAAIPGANVTATELATGATRTTASNAEGVFRLAGLPAGRYTIDVTLDRFQPLKVTEVPLAPAISNMVQFTNLNTDLQFQDDPSVPGVDNLLLASTTHARYTTTNNNIGTTPPRQIGITLRLDF
jgi:hypothetical protein